MNCKAYDYNNASESEINRLRIQTEVMKSFDIPVYRQLLSRISSPVVLDIGCNNGEYAMSRLKDGGYSFYLGVDRSSQAIESAGVHYADDSTVFICADLSEAGFENMIYKALSYSGGFADIIIVSMVLLHLANPTDLLKKLHGLLREGGTIIVKDIDDRDNSSSSDPDGIFAHAYEIACRNTGSGNRHAGRNVPMWLEKAGYSSITLCKKGLSTDGMNSASREALFTTYFGFFEEDCQAQISIEPSAADDLLWCRENLPRIKECLLREDFWFSLGFCMYTATR